MKILILSDIHANADALKAVLSDAGDFDETWCLGDIVGYGPDPNECIETLMDLPNLFCIIGNHDAAAIGQIPLMTFNHEAKQSIQWLKSQLSDSCTTFLQSLQEKIIVRDVTLTHGSPRSPIWEYIMDRYSASENFQHFHTGICLVGHTHLPSIFEKSDDSDSIQFRIVKSGERITINTKTILNPGSVGQPRDRDPRSSYAIFSPGENSWEIKRVDYDIKSVQSRIKNADLPYRHASRLSHGW